MLRLKLITPLFLILISFFAVSQTTRNAGTATELINAISASANGDIINITNNIVISAQVSISGKTITINGNNYEITVPRPSLDDMGRFNSSPSAFRVFDLSSSSSVSINDLKINGQLLFV